MRAKARSSVRLQAGGVAGALLGVAALAIPGVGQLAAAGAIAASAVPTAAGVGAALGATGGAIARMLSEHDVGDYDAAFYEERIQSGDVFVSVDTRRAEGSSEAAQEILQRYGGQSGCQLSDSDGIVDVLGSRGLHLAAGAPTVIRAMTRNSQSEADLVDQLLNSSEKRLAHALLLLANFGKEGRPEPILGKISQETLAE